MKTLKQFPILHRFYTEVLKNAQLTNDSHDKLLSDTKNYQVTGRCMCKDKDCATIYMKSDNTKENEICEILSYDKAFIILHIENNGDIKLEALSSTYYPYVEEFIDIFENELTSACSKNDAKVKVDNFFNKINEEDLNIIYVE